jgi:hypothetical protein
MIPLNDFVPCDRVAGNAATDQQSSHLGVFQDLLPGNRCGQDKELSAISRQLSGIKTSRAIALLDSDCRLHVHVLPDG